MKRHRKIGTKIFIMILFSVLVSAVFIYFFTNVFMRDVVFSRYLDSYLDSVYLNIQEGLEKKINDINRCYAVIAQDSALYSVNRDKIPAEKKQRLIGECISKDVVGNKTISGLRLELSSGMIYCLNEIDGDISDEFKNGLKSSGLSVYDKIITGADGTKYIVFAQKVTNFNTSVNLGNIYFFVDESCISEAYENLASGDCTFSVLYNDIIISNKDKDKIGYKYLLPDKMDSPNKFEALNEYVYCLKTINPHKSNNEKWQVLGILSYKDLYNSIMSLQKDLVYTMMITICMGVLLAVAVSYSLVSSINSLKQKMHVFAKNQIVPDLDTYSEIAELEMSFHSMAEEIEELIRKNNEEKERQRITEIKALQSQINSHFIYNAMDGIHWLAKINGQNYIAEMIYAVSTFFRISLSRGETIISIREELKHVECYITIEQMRFKELFDVMYQIDDEILEYKTPKIILQPIVENCVKHGFDNIDSGGIIKIVGYSDENGDIVFKISDNGKGFDTENINNKNYSGYGIKNVNARIQMYCGQQYGISYLHSESGGVTAFVRIKKMK